MRPACLGTAWADPPNRLRRCGHVPDQPLPEQQPQRQGRDGTVQARAASCHRGAQAGHQTDLGRRCASDCRSAGLRPAGHRAAHRTQYHATARNGPQLPAPAPQGQHRVPGAVEAARLHQQQSGVACRVRHRAPSRVHAERARQHRAPDPPRDVLDRAPGYRGPGRPQRSRMAVSHSRRPGCRPGHGVECRNAS
ncbi:hypothetical protein D9M72_303250 [compost metagenome]